MIFVSNSGWNVSSVHLEVAFKLDHFGHFSAALLRLKVISNCQGRPWQPSNMNQYSVSILKKQRNIQERSVGYILRSITFRDNNNNNFNKMFKTKKPNRHCDYSMQFVRSWNLILDVVHKGMLTTKVSIQSARFFGDIILFTSVIENEFQRWNEMKILVEILSYSVHIF